MPCQANDRGFFWVPAPRPCSSPQHPEGVQSYFVPRPLGGASPSHTVSLPAISLLPSSNHQLITEYSRKKKRLGGEKNAISRVLLNQKGGKESAVSECVIVTEQRFFSFLLPPRSVFTQQLHHRGVSVIRDRQRLMTACINTGHKASHLYTGPHVLTPLPSLCF